MTKTERLLLLNQYNILAQLDKHNAEEHELKAQIVTDGHTELYYVLTDVLMEERSNSVGKETHDILTMYRIIEDSVEKLPAKQKKELNIRGFEGFDGNNDDHYSYARFIIEKMRLYAELRKKDLNSHSSASLPMYRRMVRAFNAAERDAYHLSFEDLKKIEAAQRF